MPIQRYFVGDFSVTSATEGFWVKYNDHLQAVEAFVLNQFEDETCAQALRAKLKEANEYIAKLVEENRLLADANEVMRRDLEANIDKIIEVCDLKDKLFAADMAGKSFAREVLELKAIIGEATCRDHYNPSRGACAGKDVGNQRFCQKLQRYDDRYDATDSGFTCSVCYKPIKEGDVQTLPQNWVACGKCTGAKFRRDLKAPLTEEDL